MSDQSSPLGWPGEAALAPAPVGLHSTAPLGGASAHPLLWARMPAELPSPPVPRSPEEALAMMERSHAATMALLPEDPADIDETKPLTRAWFDGVREACAATGRVPGVERMLFEWWLNEPPIEGLSQLPWLFGVWQGHWVCWAGTTPWAAADLAAKSTYEETAVVGGVQFGADPDHPPATPWPPFGTAALAVPTTILVALSGKPAPSVRLIPATPLYVAPVAPEPPPAPAVAPVAAVAVAATALDADTPDTPLEPELDAPTDDAPAEAEVGPDDAADAEPEVTPEAVEDDGVTVDDAEAPDEPTADPIAEVAPEATAAEPDADGEPADDADPSPETEEEVVESAVAVAAATGTESVWAPDPEPAAEVAPVAPIEAPPQPQNLPPAGWHPDPSGRHALRYWDGTTWTAHAADPGTDTLHDPI